MINARKIILLISIIALTPFMVLSVLLLINVVNPMQMMFLTRFTVENQCGQTIWVTPIGTVGEAGRKYQLPIYYYSCPALPSVKTGEFRIPAGSKKEIIYDFDDINFSELVIRLEDNSYFQLVADPIPTDDQYHSPRKSHFTISSIDDLSPVQDNVYAAAKIYRGMLLGCVLQYGEVIIIFIYWRLNKAYKKLYRAKRSRPRSLF